MEEIMICFLRGLLTIAVTPFIIGIAVFGFRMLAYAIHTNIEELWNDFWED